MCGSNLKQVIVMVFVSFFMLACGEASLKHVALDNTNENMVEISGRAIKGVLKGTRVNAYTVSAGKPNTERLGTALTGSDGSFSIVIPKWKLRKLTYLELSATGDATQPSTMVCDAYKGCGVRNARNVEFGEEFLLSEGVLLRSVIRLESGSSQLIANFSPLKHMVVARAENKVGGITWDNISAAEKEITQLFLLSAPLNSLAPVDLLSSAEVAAASDEQLVLAVIEATFLNVGLAPNYTSIEAVLDKITRSGGQFEVFDEQAPTRLTITGLLLSARDGVRGVLSERPQVLASIESALIAELDASGAKKYTNESDDIEQLKLAASQTYSLDLSVSDGGHVSNLAQNLDCTMAHCTTELVENASFTLTALVDEGFKFAGWSGDCEGTVLDCRLNMDGRKNVSASFVPTESGSILLSWTMPALREDGSPFLEESIHHYSIFYGEKSGMYLHRVSVGAGADGRVPTEVSIDGLTKGARYYFAGIVVDKRANFSVFSNEVVKVAP